MTLFELDEYFNSFLHRELFASDPSRNGIQIENSSPFEKQITKVAFATDACVYTAQKAAQEGAQLLFVHHGLFWGDCTPIIENQYKRISTFIKNDIALYASHIPLDANNIVGNNYGLAKILGLTNLEPFGLWNGMTIGVKGILPKSVTITELAANLFPNSTNQSRIFSFGKEQIKTVAIISGGAGEDVDQAYRAGVDAYITGEVEHQTFHIIKELNMNVIAGGHYQTETIGVNLVKNKLEVEKHLETVFIDFPTGL